ncbi:hypothetical protein [Methanobrevibacter sp.]
MVVLFPVAGTVLYSFPSMDTVMVPVASFGNSTITLFLSSVVIFAV